MQRIIGLDVGSYSIKAVEIVNTFKSYEIANFYEKVIPRVDPMEQDEAIHASMAQLFEENNLKADRILTAMPGQYISSRIIPFNFSDVRKIETAVISEIEDAVPFTLDQMIVDHQILGTVDGKTLALVVMTKKIHLRSFLEHLQGVNIDPKLIDIDSLAFYNLASYMDLEPGVCSALVDIGHEKTSVCIILDGYLRMFRSINMGGAYLTDFLARDLETGFNEAQTIKHNISRMLCEEDKGTDLVGDEKKIAERMTLAANAIVKELGRTLYSFKTWEKSPIEKIYISGGSTKIKNFNSYLQDQLELPVVVNRLDESSLKISPTLSEHMTIMPQSVAIGVRGVGAVKRYSQVNLRRQEFAFVQDYESILKGAGIVFKFVAVALVLLCISYSLKHFFYSRQIDALQGKYLKSYTSMFPDAKSRYKPGKYTFAKLRGDVQTRLLTEIEQKQAAVEGFVSSNSSSPAMVILKDLSKELSKDVKLDVTLFQYTNLQAGGGKLVLGGETDGYASVAKLIESMKKVKSIKDVEEKSSGAKPGTNNKIIKFTINASYSGTENIDAM